MYLFLKQYAHAVMTDSDDAHALQCRPNYHLHPGKKAAQPMNHSAKKSLKVLSV